MATKKTKKKGTVSRKRTPAKKQAQKKKAPRKGRKAKATPKKAAPKKAAPKKAAPKAAIKPAMKRGARAGAEAAQASDHHLVSPGQMKRVASTGLRDHHEIARVEEDEVAPCRLVDHGDGRWSLCLDDFRMPPQPVFEARGLMGTGYTWEAVADSLVRKQRPDIASDVTYDSEAGMFVALGSRESLRVVARLLQQAIASPKVLEEAVRSADPNRIE